MIAETQVLILAATGLVFAVVSMGVLNSHKDGKDKHVTPASHGHFAFNNYSSGDNAGYESPSEKEEIPRHAADIVVDAIGHHYTPPEKQVDALVNAYVETHKDEPIDIPKIREATKKYLIKEYYKLHDSSP